MAIYKPSNHNPNLQEVDLDNRNTFSCVVNTSGESVMAYKLRLLSEDGETVIADGHYRRGTEIYEDGAINLLVPLKNKEELQMQGINSNFHMSNQNFNNGENYQWGTRVYNAPVGSTNPPNTKVCDGRLVGSTKYVIWTKLDSSLTGSEKEDVLNQLVYDRFIEIQVTNPNQLMIGEHEKGEKDIPKPNGSVISSTNPYIQRKKIDWVEKNLGIDERYIKIETTEDFDYNYLDGQSYTLYQCDSAHTVKSAFADPNSNINITDFIIIYKTLSDAQTARAAGETPGDIKDKTRWADCMKKPGTNDKAARKISGYSSDTGEMRFADSFSIAPSNNQCYRLFRFDTLNNTYTPIDDAIDGTDDPLASHILGGKPITDSHFKITTNKWNSQEQRLFIQPNINIGIDTTNPNEIIFNNGVRIDIVEQYYTYTDSVKQKKIDISLDKLDNTQWVLELHEKNERPGVTEIPAIIPSGQTVPIVPQSDYTIYTDFSDSMPYNIFYARKSPVIKLQFRNALKQVYEGYMGLDGKFYDKNGNEITFEGENKYLKSTFLYHDANEDKYYEWIDDYEGIPGHYSLISYYLVEGNYDKQSGEFYDKDGNLIIPNVEDLYLDLSYPDGLTYYKYDEELDVYEATENKSVVWVDVDSALARDYREVEFRILWLKSDNDVIISQIKNYQYSLYACVQNNLNTQELVKTSKIIYNTDGKWTFRGLDGTTTDFYNILNPHIYKIYLKIIDEYDKEYIIEKYFKIFYETENAPVSIDVTFLCDEHAHQVSVVPPAFAMSDDYVDFEGDTYKTVTNSDIDTTLGRVKIDVGSTLNYDKISVSRSPLVFPKSFSFLTKLSLTEDFVDKCIRAKNPLPESGRESLNEVELLVLNHSLESIKHSIMVGSSLYLQTAPINTICYKDRQFTTPIFLLETDRPYKPYYDDYGVYGKVSLSDSDLNLYYIDIQSSNIYQGDNLDDINDSMDGVEIKIDNNIYSEVSLKHHTDIFDSGSYYVFTKQIISAENNEEFIFKINAYGPYFEEKDEDGNIIKVHPNQECYYLFLYSKQPSGEIRRENCFFVNGRYQNYINLLDPNDSGFNRIKSIFALQSKNDGGYVLVDTLPLAQHADVNKKYVLTKLSSGSGSDDSQYPEGVYVVLSNESGKYWSNIITESYIYVDSTNDIGVNNDYTYQDLQVPPAAIPGMLDSSIVDGEYRSSTVWHKALDGIDYDLSTTLIDGTDSEYDNSFFVYREALNEGYSYYYWNGSQLIEIVYDGEHGNINWIEDNNTQDIIWVDSDTNLEGFKKYISDKSIQIFLKVDYNDLTDSRTIKSQVVMKQKGA